MNNLSIFISKYFFFDLTFLEKVKQNISCNISLFLIIIALKVVLKECLSQIDLLKA